MIFHLCSDCTMAFIRKYACHFFRDCVFNSKILVQVDFIQSLS